MSEPKVVIVVMDGGCVQDIIGDDVRVVFVEYNIQSQIAFMVEEEELIKTVYGDEALLHYCDAHLSPILVSEGFVADIHRRVRLLEKNREKERERCTD